jgi:hypothetical protein
MNHVNATLVGLLLSSGPAGAGTVCAHDLASVSIIPRVACWLVPHAELVVHAQIRQKMYEMSVCDRFLIPPALIARAPPPLHSG